MGNQWSWMRVGVIWTYLHIFESTRAAAFVFVEVCQEDNLLFRIEVHFRYQV